VRPAHALVALVLVVFLAYASLGAFVRTPRIFYDELIYMEAADSLAHGHSPQVREGPYEYGILYPAVLAPVVWAAPNREVGYELAKILNALLFALTAVPIYFLARRLLRPWPSVAVAALSVAIPSAVYVSVVMTESLAYLVASCALYAILLAVERPSVSRQIGALGAIAVAYLARAQFIALYGAFVAALVLVVLLVPERRARWRLELRRLWVTLLSLAAGLVAFVLVPLVSGEAPQDRLGRYQDLWRSYDVATVARWLVCHVADLDLYLAVIPFVVAPVFLAMLFTRARAGSGQDGAFLAVFTSVNAVMLVVVAVVVTYQESSGSGTQRLHDRYLFYVVPLWLISLFGWLQEGAPWPRWATRAGVVFAVVFAALLPLAEVDVNDGAKLFSAVGTGLPGIIGKLVDPAFFVGRLVLAVLAVILILLARRPGRALRVSAFALLVFFVIDASLAWGHAFAPPEQKVWAGSNLERRWVDEAVPAGAEVTMVTVDCGQSTLARDSFFQTEFFNGSVGRVLQIGGDFPNGHVSDTGEVDWDTSQPVKGAYVVVQPGIALRGRRVAQGTAAGLTLWRVDGPVRVVGVRTASALRQAACSG
jgi:hypothetical protein